MKEEFVDNEKLNILNEIVEEDRTIKTLEKDHRNEIEKLEEALHNCIGENDLKFLKTEFPDNRWKFLTNKLSYISEYFNCLDDYQKSVNNLKKEDSFSKFKNKCPDDNKIGRTKESIEKFNIKNGEGVTQLYLKSDVLLLACVFETFIKVSLNDIGINPLYCVSLPGYTWQCELKYTGINLQALQGKDSI